MASAYESSCIVEQVEIARKSALLCGKHIQIVFKTSTVRLYPDSDMV
jgi:hypothetical protein